MILRPHINRKTFNNDADISAFTIVELLIIMVVFAVLASFFISQFPGTLGRTRDTERKSDLDQYAIALGTYSIKSNGIYPVHTTSVNLASLCGTLDVPDCPDDPQLPSKQYLYQSNADGTEFVLWADLEKETSDWAKCSNGSSGFLSATPTLGNCPLLTISPTATSTPAAGPTNTPIPTNTPGASNTPTPPPSNLLVNPDFDLGINPWALVTNGVANTTIVNSGPLGNRVRVRINSVGTNTYLHQSNLTLYPNTQYYLEFSSQSNSGNDIRVYVDEGDDDFTNYGLSGMVFNLTSSMQTYSTVFTTNTLGGANPATDARLRFWFVDDAQSGDQYEFDSIILRQN